MTSGQSLVKGGVVSSVKLVDDHLPDGVGPGGALAGVTVTLVGHPEVEGVGPLRHAGQGGGDGGVIGKELIRHHLKLRVAAHPEEGGPHPGDGAVADVGEPLDDQPGAGHLGQPVVVASLGPVVRVVLVGDGEDPDLVTLPVELLDGGVVGVSVGHVEGALDGAAIRVDGLSVENVSVQINVVGVNGPVESNCDHLRHLVGVNISRDSCSIRRTETIRKLTRGGVTFGGAVGILM